jgi:hypothetical protein
MLPERLAVCVKTAAALRMLRVELDLPPLVEAAWWHESTNADPGHRRFLSLVPGAASGLVTLVPTENDYPALRSQLIFGERHLRAVLAEYEAHYNGRRPHRSRQLRPPRPDHPVADLSKVRIKRQPVLGGLISEYERAA